MSETLLKPSRTNAPERQWHAVQIKPGGAELAERNLARQGFQTFLPRCRTTRRSGRRLVTRSDLLFTGYGFVSVDPAASWAPISGTYGVARLLMGPDQNPACLPTGFVDALRRRCDDDGYWVGSSDLAPGTPVRIVAGPFSDLLATVERLQPLERVLVLLGALGQSVRVSVPTSNLIREAASAA